MIGAIRLSKYNRSGKLYTQGLIILLKSVDPLLPFLASPSSENRVSTLSSPASCTLEIQLSTIY
jgi:hypothetical protein